MGLLVWERVRSTLTEELQLDGSLTRFLVCVEFSVPRSYYCPVCYRFRCPVCWYSTNDAAGLTC